MPQLTDETKKYMGDGDASNTAKGVVPATRDEMQESLANWANWWTRLEKMSDETGDWWNIIATLVGNEETRRIHPDDMPDFNVLHDFVREWGDFIVDMQMELKGIDFEEEGWTYYDF